MAKLTFEDIRFDEHAEREHRMNIALSDDEMSALALLANQAGTTKVGLIRGWIQREVRQRARMPTPLEMRAAFEAAWGNKIVRKR